MLTASKKTMLSAIQPSSHLTIGNYLGALKNWVLLQDQYDCLFFAVDLHAITVRQDPAALREQTLRAMAVYLAAGIDPKHCTLFIQSHVPEHAELAWLLTCFSYMGELGRMTQYKDKSARQGENIAAGLFTYPVLMAADILLYQTHLVPVGEDQKQHIELTRDLAIRLNQFAASHHSQKESKSFNPLFTVPEPYIAKEGARIMSLQMPTAKMSKSDSDPHASIFLNDSNDTIVKKLKRAVTDSGSEISLSDDKPGIKNLLMIQAALTGQSALSRAQAYAGKQYGHLKLETADLIIETLAPIREKTEALLSDRTSLEALLADGAEKARARASKTLGHVKESLGFLPKK